MSRSFGHWVLAVIGAAVVAACSPSTPGGDEASIWLLISTYGADRVEILSTADDLDDLVRGTPLTNPGGACGVAVHGNRLYVADYDEGVIRAFPLGAALGGAAPAPSGGDRPHPTRAAARSSRSQPSSIRSAETLSIGAIRSTLP